MAKSVFIGMSGGVDSSVAAHLLKEQGYEVTGVCMRLCENNQQTVNLARSVADKLGISFIAADYRDEFKEFVVIPFVEAYEKGLTPNPCIECNRYLKFDKLLDDSDEGYEDEIQANTSEDIFDVAPKLATGHYARIEEKDGRWMLRKSSNLAKDQSYFLYTLSQETLSRTLFPLGEMNKDEVREIAQQIGLANAKSKDSQDICFIPDGNHYEFIKNYTGKDYPAGNFVDMDGNILGRHCGIIKYTIGQRKGLGLALPQSMYVYKLDIEKNEVVLAYDEDLFRRELSVSDFNWVSMACPGATPDDALGATSDDVLGATPDDALGATSGSTPSAEPVSFRALGRIRYRHKEAPCTVYVNDGNKVSVVFDEAQRAITAGQSLVLYDIDTDSYVLGGGIIE